jgi:preprotein translocase subunit YajC
MVAVLGMGLVLAGCGDQAAAGSTGSQDAAKNAFLAERGGNATPGADTGTGSSASGTAVPGNQTFRAPGLFGTVEKVDANKITIKSQSDGTETVVQLADGAAIHKQSEAQAADIKEGDTVTAIGTKNGDVIEAETVEIGNAGFGAAGGGAFFGGPGGGGRFNGTPGAGRNGGRAFPSGTPPAGFGNGQGGQRFRGGPNASGTPGVGRDFAAGKVVRVEGDTYTVTTNQDTVAKFKVGANTHLQKQVEMQLSDLKVGNAVVAMGQQNGDVFEATALQVVEALPGRTPAPAATAVP